MRILIAIDGSAHSSHTLDVVLSRPWPADLAVKLVQVVSGTPIIFGASHDDDALFAAGKALRQTAEELRARLPEAHVEYEVLEGNVRDAILEASAGWPADLVCVGSRGHSLLENVLLGSVSQAILERAQCPVLIARPAPAAGRGNILIATDNSDCSAAATEWLAAQSWAQYATICLLAVGEPLPARFNLELSISRASEELLAWQNERYMLESVVSLWADRLIKTLPGARIYRGVVEGEPRQAILAAAAAWPAEIIVMGAHGRGALGRLVLGSVSQHVAAHAACSVEVVRGRQSRYFAALRAAVEEQNTLTQVLATRTPAPPRSGFDLPRGMPFI